MKSKLATVTFLGLVVCSSALSQTNAPVGDTNTPASDQTTNAVLAAGGAPTGEPAVAPIAGTNEVTTIDIRFPTPLTAVIDTLARQAGINYIIDPKVGFGQPGPGGAPTPEPNITIRWENVTAEAALTALLNNYGLQMTEDPKTKISRVTIKDPAAKPPILTKIIQLKYAAPSNTLVAIQSVFTDPRSKVVPDVRTSQLVVSATEPELDEVDTLVARLDTITKQVLIECRLIETTVTPSTSKGVDWSGTLAGQKVTFGNGLTTANSQTTINEPGASGTTTLPGGRTASTPSSMSSSAQTVINTVLGGGGGMSLNTMSGPTPNIGFLNADGVSAVISFLNNYAEAKVISAPRTVTLDNEPAHISVTRASPIINVTAGTANTTGGSQILYTNLGVIFDVTPRISANNFINLRVIPQVSRKFDRVSFVINGLLYQADEYDIRQLEAHVMIPSGNTLVMGGMIQDSVNTGNVKVPVLGDIPVLGQLFRSDTKSRQKANLNVFITPTIVQDSDYQPTKTTFLQTPVPTKDFLEGEWSSLDSGKPYDWSNPQGKAYDDAVFNDKLGQPNPTETPATQPAQMPK